MISTPLLSWYQRAARQLPWRATRNPYCVWLSEIILQQTRVSQGWDYYERFLRHFPTIEDLARADEDEVLRLWQGLGYYSRARNMLRAAREVVRLGGFPKDYDALKRLPGVGAYTAAAIASLAFGLPYAVVDGNVYRILSRYYALEEPIDTSAGQKVYAQLAQEWLPEERPAEHNQAMMDLGAMVCLPRNPKCAECPLAEGCLAREGGTQESFPRRARAKAVRNRYFTYLYLRCEGDVFLRRRPHGDIWQGLYEPLLLEFPAPASFSDVTKKAALPDGSTFRLVAQELCHQLTHQRLHADAYLVWLPQRAEALDGIWIKESSRDDYATSRLVERIYEKIDNVSQEETAPLAGAN